MLLSWLAALASADSPLTSTNWSSAYADLPAVAHASAAGLDPLTLAALLSELPLDRKAAIVDALGWNIDGQDHASVYLDAVGRQLERKPGDLPVDVLTPEQAFLAGYLRAMDDYLALTAIGGRGAYGAAPLALLDRAAAARPREFTIQWITALVHAQAEVQGDWCKVWTGPSAVLDRFPPPTRTLRPAAIDAATAYLQGYASECPVEKLPPALGAKVRAEQVDQLNQIYVIGFWGDQVVTGTQGGVVVWRDGVPVEVHEEFICSSLEVHGGALFAGCHDAVLRWDGHTWTRLLAHENAEYDLLTLPDGRLVVRGGHALGWDDAKGVFGAVPQPLGGYDAVVRKDGSVWSIDFLSAVIGPSGPLPLGSAGYPGHDPRKLFDDPSGRLWVVDFRDGYFRWDPARKAFAPVPEGEGAAGTAVDAQGDLTVLVDYRKGVRLIRGTSVQTIDLAGQDYLRDARIDGKGQVWVSGWHGLVRLVPEGAGWRAMPPLVVTAGAGP